MKYKNEIYPGQGACEACGSIDPCLTCMGVSSLSAPWSVRVNLKAEKDSSFRKKEKNNSIPASVTEHKTA